MCSIWEVNIQLPEFFVLSEKEINMAIYKQVVHTSGWFPNNYCRPRTLKSQNTEGSHVPAVPSHSRKRSWRFLSCRLWPFTGNINRFRAAVKLCVGRGILPLQCHRLAMASKHSTVCHSHESIFSYLCYISRNGVTVLPKQINHLNDHRVKHET